MVQCNTEDQIIMKNIISMMKTKDGAIYKARSWNPLQKPSKQ